MLSFFIPLLVSLKISSKCFDVMCYVVITLGLYHILKILCENSYDFSIQSIVLKTLNTEDILENSLGWWCFVLQTIRPVDDLFFCTDLIKKT